MSSELEDAWREVSPYLDEVLALERESRQSWLDDLEVRAPAIAARIRSYLLRLAELDEEQFLSTPAAIDLTGSAVAGQTFGSYTLERPIGHGGMGTVWLANRADGQFEGRAAIKLPNLAFVSLFAPDRLTREGRILARLSHPNIARLLDAGVTKSGQPYLVLDYVEGEAIDQWCDSRELGIYERLRCFRDVLAAVQHAHSKLILHRDLKPSNILVTSEGGVRLLDFGIATLLDDDTRSPESSQRTQFTSRMFTPAYAAPEQVQGGEVTIATDIYALGVILYVLLSGKHPTLRSAQTPVEQMRAVVEADAPRLSDNATGTGTTARYGRTNTTAFARTLRGDLDNIVSKALKKSPGERYATVDAFAEDLRRFLNHEPVLARPDTVGYRASKFVRRHRVGVVAAAVTLLALIGGVVGTTWQAIEAQRAKTLAEANEHEAQEQRSTAEFEARIARANHEFLSQVFGDAMRGGETSSMRQRLDRARDMLGKHYASDPKVHANLLLQLAGRYDELNDYQREAQVMQEFNELSARTGDGSLQANVECIQAFDLLNAGQPEESAAHIARGFDFMRHAARDWSEAGSECYRADAMLAMARGDRARAVEQMNQWLNILKHQGLDQTRSYLSSLGSLAFILLKGDDLQAALDVNRHALALNESLGSGDTLANCINLSREAQILLGLGRFSEALAVDQELTRRLQADGTDVPLSFRTVMAHRALTAGQHRRAVALLQSVLPTYERPESNTSARGVLLDLAEAYLRIGQRREAARLLVRYDSLPKNSPPAPSEAIEASRVRLSLALANSKSDASLRQLRSALDTALRAVDVPRLVKMNAHLTAGLGALTASDLAGAREHATQALSLAQSQRLPGQSSAWIGAAQLLLARIDHAAGAAEMVTALADARKQLQETVDPDQPWRVEADRIVLSE